MALCSGWCGCPARRSDTGTFPWDGVGLDHPEVAASSAPQPEPSYQGDPPGGGSWALARRPSVRCPSGLPCRTGSSAPRGFVRWDSAPTLCSELPPASRSGGWSLLQRLRLVSDLHLIYLDPKAVGWFATPASLTELGFNTRSRSVSTHDLGQPSVAVSGSTGGSSATGSSTGASVSSGNTSPRRTTGACSVSMNVAWT